jgi:hypothetical protein
MHNTTQAYNAGLLIASVFKLYKKRRLPSLNMCMVNFSNLRFIFGERLWNLFKHNKNISHKVLTYEALTYQPFLPRDIIGTEIDFCLGFAKGYKNKKKSNPLIESYLTERLSLTKDLTDKTISFSE